MLLIWQAKALMTWDGKTFPDLHPPPHFFSRLSHLPPPPPIFSWSYIVRYCTFWSMFSCLFLTGLQLANSIQLQGNIVTWRAVKAFFLLADDRSLICSYLQVCSEVSTLVNGALLELWLFCTGIHIFLSVWKYLCPCCPTFICYSFFKEVGRWIVEPFWNLPPWGDGCTTLQGW